jgi:hypothetical protein
MTLQISGMKQSDEWKVVVEIETDDKYPEVITVFVMADDIEAAIETARLVTDSDGSLMGFRQRRVLAATQERYGVFYPSAK